MVRGLYTAWTGLQNEQKRLDVIANNIANSATTGYKQEGVTSQSFDDMLAIKVRDYSVRDDEVIGKMTLGVKVGEVYTNHGQGSIRVTGNTFDLALDGSGFFTVKVTDTAGNDHIRYTRAGNFTITRDGYITDADGNRLQSEGGDLMVPTDTEVIIDQDGSVIVNGEVLDRLMITDFEDYNYLKKYADTMYEPVDGAVEKETAATVRQGCLEQSNVNVVKEMTQMIAITRAYEANQKIVQTMDGSLEQAVNSVGRV
ncbi:MAG: flagellar hook-basal body protein [Lachnospiraceae bacterium]|nr:flagellar hook-basal body protein [Lachnospiraceae bacterium]MBP3610485.1 flagellar hook-basal body protein [Lachnospiraceae bacterium]